MHVLRNPATEMSVTHNGSTTERVAFCLVVAHFSLSVSVPGFRWRAGPGGLDGGHLLKEGLPGVQSYLPPAEYQTEVRTDVLVPPFPRSTWVRGGHNCRWGTWGTARSGSVPNEVGDRQVAW